MIFYLINLAVDLTLLSWNLCTLCGFLYICSYILFLHWRRAWDYDFGGYIVSFYFGCVLNCCSWISPTSIWNIICQALYEIRNMYIGLNLYLMIYVEAHIILYIVLMFVPWFLLLFGLENEILILVKLHKALLLDENWLFDCEWYLCFGG